MVGAPVFSHIVSTKGRIAAAQVWIVMENRCLVTTAPVVHQIVPLDFAHNLEHAALVNDLYAIAIVDINQASTLWVFTFL